MADSVRIKIEGLSDLDKALSNLTKAVGKGVLRRSLKQAAEPMADLARSLTPEDTGALKKSIEISALLNGKEKSGHRKLHRDDRSAVELFVGPSYKLGKGGRHGHLVEFGTAPHKNKGQFAGTWHPGTAPRPFMRPAFDTQARPTVERLRPILWSEIEKAAAKAARKEARRAAKAAKANGVS